MLRNRSLQSLAYFFDILRLPFPRDCDLADVNRGFILPLEDYGALIRIEQVANAEEVCYPVGVESILSFHLADGVHFGLYPGLNQVGISEAERAQLQTVSVCEDDIFLSGDADDDFGYISKVPAENFPNGIPAALDLTDAVQIGDYPHGYPVNENMRAFAERTAKALKQAQIERYGDIRLIAHFMISATGEEREQLTKIFWQAMREGTNTLCADGFPVLGAPWKTQDAGKSESKAEDKKRIVDNASSAYAQRLRQDPFHAPLCTFH